MSEPARYLRDLLEHLAAVSRFTAAGRDDFMADDKTQFAVIRAYEVIGEIAKRLPQTFRDTYSEIDWRRLAGFRDFLAHNYEEIILEFVWNAVEDLPNLRATVKTVLAQLPEDDSE